MAGKERSPNYPQLSLSEAIDLVRKFFAAEGRTPVDQETAAKALGYNGTNGASRTKVGALKQYNLLQGRGDTISVSPLAVRIVHPDDDADYAAALREAAGSPAVFASLLETHAEASENAIVAYLVKNKGFTPDGARQAAKSFKDTLSLAKLGIGAYTDGERRGENGGVKDTVMQEQIRRDPTPPPPPAGSVQRTFTTGNEAMDAAITITSHSGEITGDDIAFLKDYLDFLERSWSRRKPQTGSAQPGISAPHQNQVAEARGTMGASIPVMITKKMEADLASAGYSPEQISKMTPQQAHDAISASKN